MNRTSTLTRSWPPLAAWGAGLVQIALGAGILTSTDAGVGLVVIGVLIVAVGAASLAWGTLRLAGRDFSLTGAVIALAGIGLTVTAFLADTASISVLAVTVAVALDAVVGVAAGRAQRALSRPQLPRTRRAPSPRAGVTGILIGSVVVAGVVTPALGATEAGRLAPDHSSHGAFFDPHNH